MPLPDLPAHLAKTAGSHDRHVPLADTLALVPALRARFGITRIADLTHLDRTGLPVVCAVVPRSADRISVYNGKGPSREHAIASAVMEAVERQCATAPRLAVETFLPDERENVVHPREFGLFETHRDRALPFVRARDLFTGAERWVPEQAVRAPWPDDRAFPLVGSNGLASGNNATEAIFHALCELVERHVWSMAHARAHARPRQRLEAFVGLTHARIEREMVDDPAGPLVVFPTRRAPLDDLERRITAAGLVLRAIVLREENLPIVVYATLWEPDAPAPAVHLGVGCSLSPEHAALRAITEAIQSRVVDISGAREDLVRAGDTTSAFEGTLGRRLRRLPHGRWYFDAPCGTIDLHELEDRSTVDLAGDLRRVAELVAAGGRRSISVVDLSPPGVPVSVVRVVAPALESATLNGRVGREIASLLRPADDS